MYVCMYVCMYVHVQVCHFRSDVHADVSYLTNHLSSYQSISLSIYLSIYLSINLSIYPIYPSICLAPGPAPATQKDYYYYSYYCCYYYYYSTTTTTPTTTPTPTPTPTTPPSISYFLFPCCFSMLSLSLVKLLTCGVSGSIIQEIWQSLSNILEDYCWIILSVSRPNERFRKRSWHHLKRPVFATRLFAFLWGRGWRGVGAEAQQEGNDQIELL